MLRANISEYHRVSHIDLADLEGYRQVVNAIADFNKVASVLVKQ